MPKYSISFERTETITFFVEADSEEAAIRVAAKMDTDKAETTVFGDWEVRDDLIEEMED